MNTATVIIGDRKFDVAVDDNGGVSVGGIGGDAVIRESEPGVYSLVMEGRSYRIVARRNESGYVVLAAGSEQTVMVETERTRLIRQYAGAPVTTHQRMEVHAPMPALVGRILVKPGDEVGSGQPLLVLEAMKMENEIKAHQAGTVKEVMVTRGQTVEKGELLLVFG